MVYQDLLNLKLSIPPRAVHGPIEGYASLHCRPVTYPTARQKSFMKLLLFILCQDMVYESAVNLLFDKKWLMKLLSICL